ncbi:MAG: hypothetical protein GXO87_13645, partial [Chlorobi bacterium]|nr:hypothetical protein [Chlorobiota bacterium]
NFKDAVKTAPRADINIFGLAEDPSFQAMRELPELTASSCLFVKDSGFENASV